MHVKLAAYAGAYLLIAASAAIGVVFAFLIGAAYHIAFGAALGVAALGGELLKPVAITSAFDAARYRQVGAFIAAAGLGAVCFVFSLAADLSLSATMRGDNAAARAAAADQAEQRRAAIRRAEAELAALPVARPAAELRALAASKRATPGANGCEKVDGPISRGVCSDVALLEAEAGRADRRAALEARLAELQTAEPAPAVGASDPLAATLAAYAGALGFEIRADRVSPWLSLLLPLFVEIGSAFGLLVARSVGAPPPAKADPELDQWAGVLTKLRAIATNGTLSGTQREFADKIGEPLASVNRAIKAAAAARRLSVDTSGNRTTVAFSQ